MPSLDSNSEFSWSFAQESPAALELPPLAALRDYEAVRELGRGATARVLEVRHRERDERLALKLLETQPAPTAAELERFRRGATLQARLSHPGIQRVLAWGGQAPGLFLLAELLPGGTLGQRLEREGRLSPPQVVRLGRALADTLRYAHGAGVVHRDLKPDNVLFAADGRPVLIDFGLARAAAEAPPLTRTGDLVGTPAFMAPEQTRPGPIGPEADAYALGALLYHALSGELPIELEGALSLLEVLERIATRPPPPLPPGAPPALREVIEGLLRKEPAQRWDLARAAQALQQVGAALTAQTGTAAIESPTAGRTRAPHAGAESEGPALHAFCQAAQEDFELLGVLGRGGMGLVLRARERALGREVALKVLQQLSSQSALRFAREAELTARLDHPGIVRVHRAGRYAGLPYIAYEQVEGRELSEALPELSRERRLDVVGEVALALGHAHAASVVHRDLKPSNVMLDASGRARVLDFGVARAKDLGTLTRSGALVGTPRYSAPEQFDTRLPLGPPTDVWALGVLLYECLTDEPPFPAATWIELAQRVACSELTPPRRLDPTISPALEAVCLRALQADAAARYPDGAAFAEDLARARAGAELAPQPPRPTSPLPALALLACGALLGGVAWRSTPSGAPSPTPQPSPRASERPAPPATLALELSREAVPLRPGLCAHPLRALEVPSPEVGLALADPRLEVQRTPRWRHLDPGPALYRFDPASLELQAARRLEGEGPPLLSASEGWAASATRAGAVQLWTLPELTRAARCQPPAPVQALALSAPAGRLLVASDAELRSYRLPDLRLEWTRAVPAIEALAALPAQGGFLLLRGQGEGARLERWSWEGSAASAVECPGSEGLRLAADGAWALTHQRKPPRLRRWRLGPERIALAEDLPLGRHRLVLCLPDAAGERALIGGHGRLGWVDLLRGERKHLQPANLELEAGASRGERAWIGGRDCLIRAGDFTAPWAYTSQRETHEGPIVALSDWGEDCEFPLHRFMSDARSAARGVPTAVARDERQAVYALPVAEQAYGTVLTWRPRPGAPPSDLPEQVHLRPRVAVICLLPRPRQALLASLDGGLYLWRDEALVVLRPPRDPSQSIAPQQTLALACDAQGAVGYSAGEGSSLERWDLTLTSRPPTELPGLRSPVLSLALGPSRLCAGHAGGEVSLFRLPGHELAARLPGTSGVVALALAGERLLAGHLDGRLRLWDLSERRLLGETRLPDLDFARSILATEEGFRVGTQLGRVVRLTTR